MLPVVPDALSARLAEKAGFRALYVSPEAIARTLGLSSPALLTLTEHAEELERIVAAVDLPVICDLGDGFGNYLNARRACVLASRIGVAAIVLRDRPPGGTELVPAAEAAGKIRAVLDARPAANLAVFAGTAAADDIDDRCNFYEEAGAEAIVATGVRANGSIDWAAFVARRSVPVGAIVPHPAGTTWEELSRLGFSFVADARLQSVAAEGLRDLLLDLKQSGSVTHRLDKMVTTAFVTDLLGLPAFRELEREFAGASGSEWTPW